MGLLDRFKAAGAALFRPEANATGNTLTEGDIERIWGGRWAEPTLSGVVVTEKNAGSVAAVYSCVDLICGTASHVPLVLFRRDGERREPARDEPLYQLLHDMPNERHSSLEWRELCQRDLELRGNAYSQVIRGTMGRVIELRRLHPDRMEVIENADLTLTYCYRTAGGQTKDFRQGEILHLRGMGDDGIVGLSPIQMHRQTIGDALALQQHGSRFFSNGAKPGLAFQVREGYELTTETLKSLKEEIDTAYSGSSNAFRTMIVPQGLEAKPVGLDMEDAQYILQRQFTRSEIYQIWRVPPHLVSDTEKSTSWGSGIEQLSLGFLIYSMQRRFVRWEQAIKRDLLRDRPELYVKHNVSALLRSDAKSRGDFYKQMREIGVYSADEIRAFEDENERADAGGDKYTIPGNWRYDDGEQLPVPGAGNQNQS